MGGFVRPLAATAVALSVAVGGCASISATDAHMKLGKGILDAQVALDLAVKVTDYAARTQTVPKATLAADAVVLHAIDADLTQARAAWSADDNVTAAAHLAQAVAMVSHYRVSAP